MPRSDVVLTAAAAAAAAILLLGRKRVRRRAPTCGLIFTGTGCSSGLPLISCALGRSTPDCKACGIALKRGTDDENWRANVGVLLRFVDPSGILRHVQIDCGKTFRDSVLRVYRAHGVQSLDGLILTHDHADAVGGLDDLRALQRYDPVSFEIESEPLRCFCDRRTLSRLRHMFTYLFPPPPPSSSANGGLRFGSAGDDSKLCRCCGLDLEDVQPSVAFTRQSPPVTAAAPAVASSEAAAVPRFIARIDWKPFGEAGAFGLDSGPKSNQRLAATVARFEVFGLAVHALPVMHGADYVCFGFGFGARGSRVAYLSDYTELLPPTTQFLREWTEDGGIELLVLDALRARDRHPVHATLEQSVELARQLRPRRTLLVGMGHTLEHRATNERLTALRAEGLDVQLAHDGQLVPLCLV